MLLAFIPVGDKDLRDFADTLFMYGGADLDPFADDRSEATPGMATGNANKDAGL